MNYGSFKSYADFVDNKTKLILGTGIKQVYIKVAQLATFANSDSKQQGYRVTEVNKLISTMLTGWGYNGNKPKSMSNNYLELILSCDNGFVVKKRLQFPHIIAWQNDNTPYNIADMYKEFSIDNWLKADDFVTPDITLVVEPTDEIITTSTATPQPQPTTKQSGRFYLYYRNLPVGVNRIHIDFHIKTQTEPIDFDLEVLDGNFEVYNDVPNNKNLKYSNVKEIFKFSGLEGNLEDITMYQWNELYKTVISMKFMADNIEEPITHDLFFYPYV